MESLERWEMVLDVYREWDKSARTIIELAKDYGSESSNCHLITNSLQVTENHGEDKTALLWQKAASDKSPTSEILMFLDWT